ncbi:MAG: GTPase HflX [Clostridia bacterium]|nr:GTPase HflX [Clostridia bacterium]
MEKEELKAILVGVQLREDISYSMDELKGLAEAAGIVSLGQVVQNMEKTNGSTLIGKGKVAEIAELAHNMEADMVIFNEELSGMQLRNLEDAMDIKVIDRTILILDIFASRATTKEGKLQVELAQLQYRKPRLLGFGKSLSRQGAGVGTRGPGEKKLEIDRRLIEKRIDDIKAELKQIIAVRQTQRLKREKNEIPVVALVGYTNSGKSATMNRLLKNMDQEESERKVFEKNMLFATLDTHSRRIKLEDNSEFILIDTVGFVSKLPHSLVEAFKSTLEEASYADLLVHIVDSSLDEDMVDFQRRVTNKVLAEIGAGDKDEITAFNKIDKADNKPEMLEFDKVYGKDYFYISAKYNEGIDELLEEIKNRIFADNVSCKLLIPYDKGNVSSYIMEKAKVLEISYEENGTLISAILNSKDYGRFKEYEV